MSSELFKSSKLKTQKTLYEKKYKESLYALFLAQFRE